jgi:O-antigen ligase
LFWVLSINGALLGFQGLLQRVDGGAKLLWLMETRLNREATSQFGPYAYRSNAAQYFNLLWPAMLGFWWWLELRCREIHRFSSRHRLLLPLVVLVAICPLVSLSRAGAAVAVMNAVGVGSIILISWRGSRSRVAWRLGFIVMAVAGVAYFFNGEALARRFASSSKNFLAGRESIYQTAWKIQADFPIFGTGPGTFEPVFQLYRTSIDEYWPTQLHNDWLETAITFGAIGLTATILALALLFFRGLVAGSSQIPWSFAAMLWVALSGCLVFAKVDFPFQIYSILFLFLLLCAVLLSVANVNGCATSEAES